MRKISVSLAAVLIAGIFAVPQPASAYANSCGTFTYAGAAAGCYYQATGPGTYKAASYGGWRILISRNGEPFAVVNAALQSSCGTPASRGVATGSIPAIAGDIVKLEIVVGCFQSKSMAGTVPTTPMRIQVGFISGGDGSGGLPPIPPPPSPPDPSNAGNAANSCVASSATGLGSLGGTTTCTYTAIGSTGEIVQMTPNKIQVYYIADNGAKIIVYSQPQLTPPGRSTYPQAPGRPVTVVVGPDAAGPVTGAIGLVVIGDSPI